MTLKLKRPAVILEGGPRNNWGYYRDDVEKLVATDAYAGRRFPYERTGTYKPHPRAGGKFMSEIWRYAP
jgi:hypothetical protein